MRRPCLWLPVFVSGAASLAVELSLQRVLAPAFGSTPPVWAALVTAAMLALSAGYLLGAYPAGGCWLAYWPWAGGAGVALVAGAHGAALAAASPLGVPWGALAAALLLSLPLAALAAVTPAAVRLCAPRTGEAGTVLAKVCAVSTAGGVFGALATAAWLVPNLGVTAILRLIAAILGLAGFLGLWAQRPSAFRSRAA